MRSSSDDDADLDFELGQLKLADWHVARAEERLQRLERGGLEDGDRMLRVFRETLDTWLAHRTIILKRIATLESRSTR